jgi:VWFA-related protein
MRLLLLIALATATLAAQSTPQDDTLTLHLSTQLVLIDVSVEDRRTHERIDHLTPADFSLIEDKTPQIITYLSEDRLPLSVVFLFDVTDTVRPILKPLAASARQMLAHLKPEDEIAVMAFSSHAELLQDFTTDHARIEDAILRASKIEDHEATFLHEDVFEATAQTVRATLPNSRRVELWITDGTANDGDPEMRVLHGRFAPRYLHSEREAAAALSRSGAAVAALVDQNSLYSFSLAHSRLNEIEDYAALTGGPVTETYHTDVTAQLTSLIDTLRERYTLGYKPSTQRPAGSLCRLRLTLSPSFYAAHPEIKKRDILIRTRQSYYR